MFCFRVSFTYYVLSNTTCPCAILTWPDGSFKKLIREKPPPPFPHPYFTHFFGKLWGGGVGRGSQILRIRQFSSIELGLAGRGGGRGGRGTLGSFCQNLKSSNCKGTPISRLWPGKANIELDVLPYSSKVCQLVQRSVYFRMCKVCTVKKVIDFFVPSRDVTNQILSSWAKFNYSRKGEFG